MPLPPPLSCRVTSMRIRKNRKSANRLAARFFLLILTMGALAALGVFLAASLGRPAAGLGPGAENLNPVERLALSVYLSARAADLSTPIGDDPTPKTFAVQPGETSTQISTHLADQ